MSLEISPVEFVGAVPGVEGLSHVVVRLPDSVNNANELKLKLTVHGQASNIAPIRLPHPEFHLIWPPQVGLYFNPSVNNVTAMDLENQKKPRPVARVLLLGPAGKLLLLLAQDVPGGHQWWVTPGGGLNAGESFEQAARPRIA